ncbi:hypothetical protein LYSHEL_26020 [Lysobacter helvus]|uniref:Uncharacterized protein n=2 Tax=Lysobacteraceae TaxID=32033 RepID=A0ABN6FV40_9GAMM|nr:MULTISPECIES: hypothetical protein [Lysobacter]BCT93577.1 hypothetical protein LYSCAS_26010 [Lysobacter caseinilyticus]BCT96731.1 hypothetical protein LYSHEL_26020 [Lysobacter helvus]
MRKEWGWVLFGVFVFYCAALFACMVRNPRYTGLPTWSAANFLDAQPFSIGAAVFALVVALRKEK